MEVLQNIQQEMTQQKTDMKNMEENIKNAINKNINEKFTQMEIKTKELEDKIYNQEKQITFLDKQMRKKNILFFGMMETEKNYDDLQNSVLSIINNSMKIRCEKWEIEAVARKGKQDDGKIRPVITTFTTMSRKLEIIRNKKCLDNINIYIKEDYSPAVLQRRKELQDELKKEREAGKNVVLRQDRIVTLNNRSPARRVRTEKNSNKRSLPESPKLSERNKKNINENTSPLQKKQKAVTMKNYLRPAQLGSPAPASSSHETQGTQKNC